RARQLSAKSLLFGVKFLWISRGPHRLASGSFRFVFDCDSATVLFGQDGSGLNAGLREALMSRLLIADDHDVVRCGLRNVLESQQGWSVVAEARDGKEEVLKPIEHKPNVAIVDYALPLMNGAEVTR